MSEDSDKNSLETSVSVAITETGIEAKAKSRFVAAVDRLFGSVAEWGAAHMEARTELRKAKTKGETQLIEAVTQYGVQKLGADPAYAERAFKRHFRKVLSDQSNLDAVVQEAAEQLRLSPPSEAESNDEKQLTEEFLDRFETYASGATTEELRQRWGRILASEVRKPGTFSPKMMRLVDELNAETAATFEELCKHRLEHTVPICISGEIDFRTRKALVGAGLLIDPGIEGHVTKLAQADAIGSPSHYARWGDWVFEMSSYVVRGKLTLFDEKVRGLVRAGDESLGVPVYILTAEAAAISEILPSNYGAVAGKLFDVIVGELPALVDARWCRLLRKNAEGNFEEVLRKEFPVS
ncbi:DUF2806 domain-containing protein [Shinella sp. CPCC 101442]|uniref:DUF2806 domain-containing protein n=1 Tax=Shinella sp. CPCC 101442 TaxID=2932265 RepID=UPI0021537F17|nr:DUF2806 domain-containing protein [Shinella sp. CPCC 101442]MCR6502597.1 DUF2806 domain-containing protein [Shinella sp. CPCC 101442]